MPLITKNNLKNKTSKEILKFPSASWNGHGFPFKALYYFNYKNDSLLFCTIIAKDSHGKLRLLPWKNGDIDMRKQLKLKELKLDA